MEETACGSVKIDSEVYFQKAQLWKVVGFYLFVCLVVVVNFSSEQQEYFNVKIPYLLAHRVFWSLYCLLCLHVKPNLVWQFQLRLKTYEMAWSELAGPYMTWVSSKKLPPHKPPILNILSLCLKVKWYCLLELHQLLLQNLKLEDYLSHWGWNKE